MSNTLMHRFSKLAVGKYRVFLIVFAMLCVISLFTMGFTEVENDVAAYLPQSYEAKQGLDIMSEQFDTYGSAQIMMKDMTPETAESIYESIIAADGVLSCEYEYGDGDGGSVLYNITLSDLEGSRAAEAAVEELRSLFDDENVYIYSAEGYSISDQINSEIRGVIVLVAIILVAVLIFTSSTYAEVLVLLITFLAAALINKGTNFMLGKISFVSDSVTIVLQLAMSLDYAIIFCNRYKQAHKTMDIEDAVTYSLEKSLTVISASSLTTIAGLLAMTFMKFEIGRDLGVALIKAIAISLLTVFLLMPALLLKFGKLMDKTEHKSFVPKINAVGRFAYSARRIVPVLFVLLLIGAYVCANNVDYAYSETMLETVRQNENKTAQREIGEEFGYETVLAVVIPNGDYDAQTEIIKSLSDIEEVKSVTGIAGIEIADGVTLANSVSYKEFAVIGGMDEISAQALFALYAADNGDAQAAANDLHEYKVPLIELFSYLCEKVDDGSVSITEAQEKTLTELKAQLDFASAQLEGSDYDRIVLKLSAYDDGEDTFALLDRINAVVKQYYPDDSYLVGNSMTAYGFKDTFAQDNVMVGAMSILMVMLVLLFTFKSLGLPVLLTLVIQGSIWINFGLTVFTGRGVLFMVYLVASAIQMGCNVDYAIVVATHYNEEREKKLCPKDAMIQAMNLSFPTIITSGTTLASAGLLVGCMVSSAAVSGMGHFVGVGSLITIFLVLFVLPSLLLVGDRLIEKTALHLSARNPHGLIRRSVGIGLASAMVFALLAAPITYFSYKNDCDKRIASDRLICDIAKELRELAVNLGAEKELWDEAKLSFAENVIIDNEGQSELSQGQNQYNRGKAELQAAKAQYAAAEEKLSKGQAEYETGMRQLEEAKRQYAEGEEKLAKVKPLYDIVNPSYLRYIELKAEYDEAVANGDHVKAALLLPNVEAKKLVFESQIAGTGYSIETLVEEYNDGTRQLKEAAAQIADVEQQLEAARVQLEEGERELKEAAAQIEAGQNELDAAKAELQAGKNTLAANAAELASRLETLEKYDDDESRLESGISLLMQSEQVKKRSSDNVSNADICMIALEYYEDDIERAEQEMLRATVVYLTFSVCAVAAAITVLSRKKSMSAVTSALVMIMIACALAAAILELSAVFVVSALLLSALLYLFMKIFYTERS